MKLKFRKIENSQWISNFFISQNNLYFTDTDTSNMNNSLCKINLNVLKENLKIKGDLNRSFLAHPNPLFSNLKLSSQTEIEIIYNSNNYIQNFIVLDDISYISFVINNQVFTSIFNEVLKLEEFQIIVKFFNQNLLIKKNQKYLIVDKNLNIIKNIEIKLNNLVEFEEFYVIHNVNENIELYNKDFKFLKVLNESNSFKKICYLNKNNILISFKNENKTILKNIITEEEILFTDAFYFRILLLEKDLLMVKDSNTNLITFIS
ncbi:hypothetical protein [Spiroplasma taiwanense]|uniref:Uncharacterized protein n=1 Tax=Spiroplasma taiwanense CT-1 TaxID=1276220 RepID=S5MCT6_9MOLU|nr:hypothetical protein [Spiroplasma taiwanense]AGR41538.1 hypothetical protein STAIW_v1c09520 [Spiroplasma taiwanense CT-1]